MLEFFFEARFTLNRLRSGPSGPFMDSFANRLKTAGYSWWTARVFLRAAAHLGRYAETLGRGCGDLDWSALGGFRHHLSTCSCPQTTRATTDDVVRGASHFLSHLRESGVLDIPATDEPTDRTSDVVRDFQQWLRQHRGCSESTLYHYGRAISDLVVSLGEGLGSNGGMGEIRWHRRETRRPTENTNFTL